MHLNDLRKIQDRIARVIRKLDERAGTGFAQSHTFENGETHHYQVNGVKSLDSFEDELLTAYIWVWSMKDHLKAVAQRRGRNSDAIENLVDSTPALQLVSDVANRAKHGTLKKSRSGKFAALDKVTLSIPQQAIEKIVFGAFDVTTDVAEPKVVEFKATIVSASGIELGDAGAILSKALEAWENHGIPYASAILGVSILGV